MPTTNLPRKILNNLKNQAKNSQLWFKNKQAKLYKINDSDVLFQSH